MKKTLALLCIGLLPFITACGESNTLECRQKANEDSFVEYKYLFTFSDNEIEKISIDWNYDFSNIEDYQSIGCTSLEDCVEKAKKQVENCEMQNVFTDCKIVDETNNKVTITANVIDDELQKENGEFSMKQNKNEVKTDMEKDGFTCK